MNPRLRACAPPARARRAINARLQKEGISRYTFRVFKEKGRVRPGARTSASPTSNDSTAKYMHMPKNPFAKVAAAKSAADPTKAWVQRGTQQL